MIRLRRTLALLTAVCCLITSPAYALDTGRYGSIKTVAPEGPARGVVILFSGQKGVSAEDEAAASAIAKAGAFVAVVDTAKYLEQLDKLNEKCHVLDADAEGLSRQIQRDYKFPNYLTPIVAGAGEGGTVAEMVLAQAPAVTIAGAVALDPSEAVESRKPLCSGLSTTSYHHGFRYGAPKQLPGFWIVGLTGKARRSDREYILRLRREGAPVELRQIGAGMSSADALQSMIEPQLAKPPPLAKSSSASPDISGLPIAVMPAAHPSKLMAIVLSGDGGWRDLDKTIAEDFQRQGVPVVGLDSLRYFWSGKTPAQTASMVAALIENFTARWHADKVALIGYSFGADVMPFAYNRLPPDLRAHVVLVALLGLSKSADFEISVRGWLGEPPGEHALAVLPEADKISPHLIQCFYGQSETDTACPMLAQRGAETFRRNGGHHFDGNYDALAEIILAGFKQRAGLPGTQ